MAEYRNNGTIYKSILTSVEDIKTKKEALFYLKSVIKLSLFGEIILNNKEESLNKYDIFAKEILENAEKNKYFLAKIGLTNYIPNARKCFEKYLNGINGKDFGKYGGAPTGNRNACKNNPKTTPDIEEEKEEEKEKRNIDNIEEEQDIFITHRYGFNGNVILTQNDINRLNDFLYRQISTYQSIEQNCVPKVLKYIIDELDRNIESGKEQNYDNKHPIMHYQILQRYINQKLKTENRKDFTETILQIQQQCG